MCCRLIVVAAAIVRRLCCRGDELRISDVQLCTRVAKWVVAKWVPMVVAALALDSCLSITSLGTLFTCTKQQQQQQTNMSIKNNIILFILLILNHLICVSSGLATRHTCVHSTRMILKRITTKRIILKNNNNEKNNNEMKNNEN